MLVITGILVFFTLSLVLFMLNKPVGFIAMQVALGLAVVYGVYAMSLWVLHRDQLTLSSGGAAAKTDGHVKTLIIDGFIDSYQIQNTVVNTLDPRSAAYAHLPRSVNRLGGAQFTYQFWLLQQSTDPDVVGSKDILLRGDSQRYNLVTQDTLTGEILDRTEDIIVKCPRIRFNGSASSLAVELNTLDDPNPPPMVIQPTSSDEEGGMASSDPSLRRNLMKLTPNSWVLYTFVFQDHVQVNEFEQGTQVRFYIFDTLYQTHSLRSAIRQNNGNLFLFPAGAIQGCKIGNLAYYNYAVSPADILGVLRAGPPQRAATFRQMTPMATPLFLSEYNKLDIYNT